MGSELPSFDLNGPVVLPGKYKKKLAIKKKAMELMAKENLSASQTLEKLKEDGVNEIHLNQLVGWRKQETRKMVIQNDDLSEMMLDSFNRNIFEFEKIYKKLEALLKGYEENNRTFEQLVVLRELKAMVGMSMKWVGDYKTVIESKQDVVNEINVMDLISKNREKMFSDNKAVFEKGMIIFLSPKAELIDDFTRWKFKHKEKADYNTKLSSEMELAGIEIEKEKLKAVEINE